MLSFSETNTSPSLWCFFFSSLEGVGCTSNVNHVRLYIYKNTIKPLLFIFLICVVTQYRLSTMILHYVCSYEKILFCCIFFLLKDNWCSHLLFKLVYALVFPTKFINNNSMYFIKKKNKLQVIFEFDFSTITIIMYMYAINIILVWYINKNEICFYEFLN